MGYGLLAAAIAAEVAGTTAMKYSEGFTRLWPSLVTVAGYLLAFTLLAQTLKTMSVGTAYAIWAGIGTAAVAGDRHAVPGRVDEGRQVRRDRARDRRRRRAQSGRCALMARRYDPERRQRIIDAAIRVVGSKGIAGLSHRSVAAEADVPLGSTTYHFKTLDELMVAALRQSNEGFAKAVQDHGALRGSAGRSRRRAGARCRGVARAGTAPAWSSSTSSIWRPCAGPRCGRSPPSGVEGLAMLLEHRTDPVTARALVALLDGICLQVLLTGGTYDEEYTREMIGRLMGRA